MLRHYFVRHYGLANGIVAAGSAVSYVVFPLGAELLLNWGTPENATEDQKSEVRTSHLFELMLFVVAGYLLHLPCIFLWSDGQSYLKIPRCLSSIYKSDSHATSNSQSTPNQSVQRSLSLIKLFKWRLFFNRDLIVIIIAHITAFISEFAADNYFYDITYKHHPNFNASWTIVWFCY